MKVEPTYSVYCHTNLINGKQYIGITKRKPQKRWGVNGSRYEKQAIGAAIQKYGWDNFAHEILATGLTREEAAKEERRLVKALGTMAPNGYNLTSGGDIGTEFSLETKKKLRDSRLGKVASQNTREKISAIHKGKTVSQETRQKLSSARKGFKESDEWKEHISEGVKGHKWSESQRENYLKNRVYAQGADVKTAKRVAQYTKDGTLVGIFGCIRDAEKSIGNNHHISDCCQGKVKTAGGFIWKYVEE